jgi:hypothetical protein
MLGCAEAPTAFTDVAPAWGAVHFKMDGLDADDITVRLTMVPADTDTGFERVLRPEAAISSEPHPPPSLDRAESHDSRGPPPPPLAR